MDATCLRCGGLLVRFYVRRLRMWRCVQCGDRFDDTVLRNRALSKPETHYTPRQVADMLLHDLTKECRTDD